MSGIFDRFFPVKNQMNQKSRSFVLKHIFKNVSAIKDMENLISSSEDHFGVPWFIGIWHRKEHLGVYLYCRRTENKKEWSIDTEYEIHVLHPNGNSSHMSSFSACFTEALGRGGEKIMTWERMEKEFLLNDELVVEIRVNITKFTGIEDFHSSMSETDDILSPVEKQMNQEPRNFVLKHLFKNVSNMKDTEDCYGSIEDHFGVPWRVGIRHSEDHLGVFLCCYRSEHEKEWSIDTEYEIHIFHPNGHPAHKTSGFSYRFTEAIGYGPKLMEWKKMEKEFLLNDELVVEICVMITNMEGIEDFHSSMSETDDILSTVEKQMYQGPRSFVLKHVFKNVSNMMDNEDCYGLTEDHFGVPWRLCIKHHEHHLGVFLHCARYKNKKKWSIDSAFEIHVLHPNGNPAHESSILTEVFTESMRSGQDDIMAWEKMKEEYTVNDELVVEVRVVITRTTGIEDFHSNMFETVHKLSTVEEQTYQKPRSFVLKHVFKNVSNMKDTESCFSDDEDHFGVPWFIGIWHEEEHLGVFLYCRRYEYKKNWSVDTEFEIHILHPNGNSAHKTSDVYQFTSNVGYGQNRMMTWEKMEKEYLVNDELVVEIRVKITKMTGIENFHSNISETVHKLPTFKDKLNQKSRSFLLKHKFKNISKMDPTEFCYSSPEDHFGIQWFIAIWHEEAHLGVYLHCYKHENKINWSIDTEYEIHVLHPNGIPAHNTSVSSYCFTKDIGIGPNEMMTWEKMKEEYIVNDELVVEIRVKIIKMTGIEVYLRRFDDEDRSDVALVVNEKKFHVSKLLLASESSYFESMFFGKFNEFEKKEIKLTDINEYDLQKYLEMLYGEDALDDETVEGILQLAEMYDTKTLVRRCEEYLSEISRKTLKEKLELSVKYKLVELKKKCISEIKTVDDVRSLIPESLRDMDHNTLADILEKTLDLK